MDPISIAAFAAAIVEIGLRVSGHTNGLIRTWKTADPVILALANEISDLVIILNHVQQAAMAMESSKRHDPALLLTLKGALHQADDFLTQLESVVEEVGSLSTTKRRFKWLKQSTVAARMQEQLISVRRRITEILLSHST